MVKKLIVDVPEELLKAIKHRAIDSNVTVKEWVNVILAKEIKS